MRAPFGLLPSVLILSLVGCAREELGPPPGAGFDSLDVDSDGAIEQVEFTETFDRFDTNGDGFIVAEENAAIVYEADGDRDGRVTVEEFRTIDLARLEADANLDGRISRAELERFEWASRRDLAAESARGDQPTYARQQPEVRWVRFRF